MKRILFALLALTLAAGMSYGQSNGRQRNVKLDDVLNKKVQDSKDEKAKLGSQSKKGQERVRVILKTLPSLDAGVQEESQKRGGKSLRKFNLLSGSVIEISVDALEDLAKHPGITGISIDAPVKGKDVMASHVRSTTGATNALTTYGVKGANIGIAIIDSGIASVPDLPNVVKSLNFTGDGLPAHSDPYGHGTHVAGLAAGKGILSNGRYRGVAPDASLIDLRVLKGDGSGNTSDVISAVEWAIINRNAVGDNGLAMNIRVINLSLGHGPTESATTDPLTTICREAVRQGIVVVAAAGNYGKTAAGTEVYGGIISPGTEPAVITVGAMTTWGTNSRGDDTLATYSSRGPTYIDHLVKPDVVAPGSGLVGPESPGSLLSVEYPGTVIDSNYMKLSGTSMATPVVSGSVALILQKNPGLTPNAVKAILMYTAEKRPQYNVMEVGAGYLNAAGAVTLAANINSNAPVGSYWLLNNGLNLSYTNYTAGGPVVWGRMLLWRNSQSTAGTGINYRSKAWSQTIVWGDTIVWDETIVWGDTIVWDETIVWGDTIVWDETIIWGESIWGQSAETVASPESLNLGEITGVELN